MTRSFSSEAFILQIHIYILIMKYIFSFKLEILRFWSVDSRRSDHSNLTREQLFVNRPISHLLWKADSGSQIPDERDHGQDGVRRSRKVHVEISISFLIDIISAKHTDDVRLIKTRTDEQIRSVTVKSTSAYRCSSNTIQMTTLTRQRTESILLILPFMLISQFLVSSNDLRRDCIGHFAV